MRSSEVFHLEIKGDRRGPYTLRQIDHLLNSGLIPPDSLYWREGMENWQPVTDVVAIRQRPRRWRIGAGSIVVLLVLLLFGRFFGPTILEGWRESAQYDFTERAAYWRARDTVRRQVLPAGEPVKFGGFPSAQVALDGDASTAKVRLAGELPAEGKWRAVAWNVALHYDRELHQWTGDSAQEAP